MANWEALSLVQRPGENGITYYTLVAKQSMDNSKQMQMGVYDPSLESKTEDTIEVEFYDEAYSHEVHKPGVHISPAWWAANGPPDVSWKQLKASPRIFGTTAGLMMGLLDPEPGGDEDEDEEV